MTSAVALFYDLRLPIPITPAREPTPLIIHGGSSAVGAFTIKLASLANIHPDPHCRRQRRPPASSTSSALQSVTR